jgi:hypothetical protein
MTGIDGTVHTLRSFPKLPLNQKVKLVIFFLGGIAITYFLYLIALSVLIDQPPQLHSLTKIADSIINHLTNAGIVK